MVPRRRTQKGLGVDIAAQARHVFAEYLGFLHADIASQDPDHARAFLARHTAARAAITHIDALLKLDGGPPPNNHDQQTAMLTHARRALAGDRPENPSDETEAQE
jgi:hypothetical protein